MPQAIEFDISEISAKPSVVEPIRKFPPVELVQ
jgi:hypothetical protein